MDKKSLDLPLPPECQDEQLFDLQKVHDLFNQSLKESEDVYLTLYLEAYKQLNKFFVLMGTMFAFVSNEIDSKVDILEKLIESSHQDNGQTIENNPNTSNGIVVPETDPFESINSMIDYEKSNNLLTKKNYVSGSRTLLRLHRGLDFIRVFLRDLSQLQSNICVSHCCKSSYNRTLAKYHSWLIRQAVILASYTMPTQGQLLIKVCGSEDEIEKTLQLLPTMLGVADEVYNRTQKLFESSNMLNLD